MTFQLLNASYGMIIDVYSRTLTNVITWACRDADWSRSRFTKKTDNRFRDFGEQHRMSVFLNVKHDTVKSKAKQRVNARKVSVKYATCVLFE